MASTKKGERIFEENALEVRRNKYTTYLNELQEGTQNYIVLERLIRRGRITTIDAFFDYHITRLSGRIYELRQMGVDIKTKMVTKKSTKGATQTYAVYLLEPSKDPCVERYYENLDTPYEAGSDPYEI